MKLTWVRLIALTALAYSFSSNYAFAANTIEKGHTGNMLLTDPEGRVQMLGPAEEIPEIPNGSTLEVFNGEFTVATEKKDEVNLQCLKHEIRVAHGSQASLRCHEDKGLVKAVKGSSKIRTPEGKELDLAEGKEYPFGATAVIAGAKATAAGEPLGLPAGGDVSDAPPVDPHSIESSPSR